MFPSINLVASELRAIAREVSGGCDDASHHASCDCAGCEVRLQVYPNGYWAIRIGDPAYDMDHHGSASYSRIWPRLMNRGRSISTNSSILRQPRPRIASTSRLGFRSWRMRSLTR